MGITNQSALANVSVVFYTKFDELFVNRPGGAFQSYTEEVSIDTKTVEHDVFEAMPVMRTWIGPKVFSDIRFTNQTFTVKQYERSFAIKRLDVVTDRTGMTERRISNFLTNPNSQIQDKICFDYLVTNPTGYDGSAIYSATHPRGPAGATQSNTTTSALGYTTFEDAMVSQSELRDENGESFQITPNVLRVGPKLLQIAMEVTGSDKPLSMDSSGASGTTSSVVAATKTVNAWGGGKVDVVLDKRMVGTYDDYWFLDDTTQGAKPVILYTLRAPEPVEQTAMDSESRFNLDELRFSIEMDGMPAAGAWQPTFAGIL